MMFNFSNAIYEKLRFDFYRQSTVASISYIFVTSAILMFPLVNNSQHLYLYNLLCYSCIIINLVKLKFALDFKKIKEGQIEIHKKIHLVLVASNATNLALIMMLVYYVVPISTNEFWIAFFIINSINTATAFSLVISPLTTSYFITVLGLSPYLLLLFKAIYFHTGDKKMIYLACALELFYTVFLLIRARLHQNTVKNLYRFEEELKDQRKITEDAIKFATLGEMAGGIAHEINNPLTIINLQLNKLNLAISKFENEEKKEHFQKSVQVSLKSVGRIKDVVAGLNLFSKENMTNKDEFIEVSIDEIFKNALNLCQDKLAREFISLSVLHENPRIKLQVHPTEVTTVFFNIFNNSIESLHGLKNPSLKKINLTTNIVGNYARIVITDSGPGIHADVINKIFIPFFTTKLTRVNHGLGLSVCRSIMEIHEGDIFVEEIKDEMNGSKFFIVLMFKIHQK